MTKRIVPKKRRGTSAKKGKSGPGTNAATGVGLALDALGYIRVATIHDHEMKAFCEAVKALREFEDIVSRRGTPQATPRLRLVIGGGS